MGLVGKGKKKIEKPFGNIMNVCSFTANINAVLLGDLKAKVGNEIVEVVGRHGNENGLCVGQRKDIYKYTWSVMRWWKRCC